MRPRPVRLTACLLLLAAVTGLRPAAQQLLGDHPGQYRQEDIATGGRVYSTQCLQCHGRDGDQVSGINLRVGLFRRPSTDADLARTITQGTPGGMPPVPLSPAELTGIVAYIRAGFDTSAAVRVGDPARGRALFEGEGACLTCHRVAGTGALAAPDLSDIGAARTPAALERSIRDPSSAMLPINRPVRIVLRDGRRLEGRRLNEDTHTVQIVDDRQRLVSLDKRRIREMEVGTRSPMPAYAGRLSDDAIADLVAYLLTLRTP